MGIALSADKAALIVGRVVQFHLHSPNVMYYPPHSATSYSAGRNTRKSSKVTEYKDSNRRRTSAASFHPG